MDELKKLVEIIKKHGQRSLQIIEREYKSKQPTKDTQLYQALVSDEYDTEEELVQKIFLTNKNDRNYKITKTRLKEKLLNNLFLLDYHKSDFTEYQSAKYDCLHFFHQGNVLMMEGDPESAVRILTHAIKKAIRFELFSLAYNSLWIVRGQYAKWGKNSMFDKLTKRISKVKGQMVIQRDYEEKFQRIFSSVNKSHNAALSSKEDIVRLIDELKVKSEDYNMRCFDVMAEELKISLGWIDLDFNSVIDACNYLEQNYCMDDVGQISVNIHPGKIYQNAIKANYVLKKYKKGLNYMAGKSAISKKGSCDWYWLEEYKLLLLLGDDQLSRAADVVVELKSCRQLVDMDSDLVERLKIYRLYLLYFMPNEKQLYWGFHWEEMIKEHPHYLSAHRSYLVSYLILQYIYLLKKVQISDLRDTLEHLKPFSAEHLSRKNNYRTSIFIRMLEIVVEKNFDNVAIAERCTNYFNKLKASRLNPELDHEFEVIPYERLWEEILHVLVEKKDYKHFRFYHLYEVDDN